MDLAGHTAHRARRGTSTPGRVALSAGGVGRNVAENLARLGCPVKLLGVLGDDLLSRWLLERTESAGVDVGSLRIIAGGTPGVYLSILERGELDRAVADPGAMETLDRAAAESLLNGAFPDPANPPALLVLDTNPTVSALQGALDWALERRVPVLVEPVSVEKSRRLPGLRGRVDFLTPNTGEARDLLRAVSGAGSALEVSSWIVTRGAAGAALFRARQGYTRLFPAPAADVVNVNGAGDAFVAALACGIVTGHSLDESIRMGLRAGALTVASPETVRRDISRAAIMNNLPGDDTE